MEQFDPKDTSPITMDAIHGAPDFTYSDNKLDDYFTNSNPIMCPINKVEFIYSNGDTVDTDVFVYDQDNSKKIKINNELFTKMDEFSG